MRLVGLLSLVLAVGTLTASAVSAKEYDRFGKGPTTIGLTPPGYGASSSGGYFYSRQYVQPAPTVATAPATDGRRTFSAEPSTPAAAAPAAAPAPVVRYYYRWRCR
jgi:hypothetical protein